MPFKYSDLPDTVKTQIFDLISPQLDFGDFIEVKDTMIDGIEVTQSIQYYKSNKHLSDPALQARDNAGVLAAYKPAWVRTYVRTNRFSPVSDIRGTLTIERRRLGFRWVKITTLNAQGVGAVTARPFMDYDTERSSIFNSLNFIIPAADCFGILRLTVKLNDVNGSELDAYSVVVHATLVQTLRLRGIMIGYNGPRTWMPPGSPPASTITLAAPTVADLQSTAALALLAMPVRSIGNFSIASRQILLDLPLDDSRTDAGRCSPNWNALMLSLVKERLLDGNRSDVVYFGLLPAAIPVNGPGCGLDGGGLGAGRAGDLTTLFHEIGHGYGFVHTPCGAAGPTDPMYPNYKPYPSASIGEYGIDISNGLILSPRITRDYMSYCLPSWISLYQYGRLVGHPLLDPKWLTDFPIEVPPRDRFALTLNDIPDPLLDPDPNPWRNQKLRREPLISIIGRVISSTKVDVISVVRVMAEATLAGLAVPLEARLLDAEGQLLARGSLHELSSQGACCSDCHNIDRHGEPPYLFQAFIPDAGPGQSLLIGHDDVVLWERQAPSMQPQFNEIHADVQDDTLQLHWTIEGSECTEAWVQWTDREGSNWNGLATGLTGDRAEISLAHLPAGDALIRVLAHDGFYTAVSDPVPIVVPPSEPLLAIMTPVDGQTLFAGSPMRLWGSVTDGAGYPLPDGEDSRWLLDGKEIGRGSDIWIESPAPGEHHAALVVNINGAEARKSATFTTIEGYQECC